MRVWVEFSHALFEPTVPRLAPDPVVLDALVQDARVQVFGDCAYVPVLGPWSYDTHACYPGAKLSGRHRSLGWIRQPSHVCSDQRCPQLLPARYGRCLYLGVRIEASVLPHRRFVNRLVPVRHPYVLRHLAIRDVLLGLA